MVEAISYAQTQNNLSVYSVCSIASIADSDLVNFSALHAQNELERHCIVNHYTLTTL